jgi:uncharacterized coiled-coil DUF342 family protein
MNNTPGSFNPTNPSPYGAPPKGNDPQKRLITIMGIAIGLLLLTSVWLMISKFQTSRQLNAANMELSEQKAALTELDAKYKDAVSQLEQQRGINEELDAKINEQIAQLEQNKSKIEGLIRQNRDYKGAMARFDSQKKQYLAEIEQLKQQLNILAEQNTQLTAEKQQLGADLTQTRTQLNETNSAKAALITEKSQLETERNSLNKKVDVASAVKAGNIQVKPVSVSSSGKEKTKSRAKRVDKLNVCFTAESNEVAEPGQETFYIIVMDPTGVPLYLETLGSGVTQDKRKGEEFRYTTVARCNYSGEAVDVCGSWEPGQNFVKGRYSVDIYNKGYKVGTGAFQLK